MSPATQPVSAVAPISDIVREEVIALLADLQEPVRARDDVRLGMDLVEIAQEREEEEPEDDIELLRISPAVPV
jgi:hypothetical protein